MRYVGRFGENSVEYYCKLYVFVIGKLDFVVCKLLVGVVWVEDVKEEYRFF